MDADPAGGQHRAAGARPARRLGVGVVGCGNVASYAYLPELRDGSGYHWDFVAACDRHQDRLDGAVRVFGARCGYSCVEDLLADPGVDVVLTLTRVDQHYDVAMRAIAAGKHVYIEKPICPTLAEASRLMRAARRAGVQLAVGPAIGVSPAYTALRALLAGGTLGAVAFARVFSSHGGPAREWYFRMYEDRLRQAGVDPARLPPPSDPTWLFRPGAGALFDMGVYGVTQATYLLGPARRVTALVETARARVEIAGGIARGRSIEPNVEDAALLLLDFGSPPVAFVEGTHCVVASRMAGIEVEIHLQEGAATIERNTSGERTLHIYRDGRGWTSSEFPAWRVADGIRSFIRSIETGSATDLTPEHARHVLEIMVRARQAAATGRTLGLRSSFAWAASAERRGAG